MRYCGSKRRFANDIVPFIMKFINSEEQLFVDMFCGGCSIISEVPHSYKLGIDNNPYVIKMWQTLKKNVLNGHSCDNIPYDITEEQYASIKESYLNKDGRWPDHVIGYVGNACSYGGAWFNGFAKPNYNKCNKHGEPENHCHEAYNGLMKQLKGWYDMMGTDFICSSFEGSEKYFDPHSVIYCDPPYANTKKYMTDFPHDKFYDWCRKMTDEGHTVLVSEYEMPEDFICIWSKEKKDGMAACKKGDKANTKVEKLFICKGTLINHNTEGQS